MDLMKVLGPLVQPLLMEVWNQLVMPELQKAESGIAQEDLKFITQAFIEALDKIAKNEIPKVGT